MQKKQQEIDPQFRDLEDVNLRDGVDKILKGYLTSKQETFAGNSMAEFIRNSIPQIIYDTSEINQQEYLVTGSPGQGNWASVPWIGIFNRNITTTATRGIYIVYLFASDCSSVYLTLNQGCTELKAQGGKNKAIQIMHETVEKLISEIDSRGFEKGDTIDLKDSHELPYLYERGTIFYREYKKTSLPENEEMVADLKKMIDIYNQYDDLKNDYAVENDAVTENAKKGKQNVKDVKACIRAIKKYIAQKGFTYDDGMIENFYLSLKSKPFVILGGISGTGKTKLVRLFAEAIGARYKIVPVRPDWSDSSDLFGHVNLSGETFINGAIVEFISEAFEDTDTPYILCLDEMNLARVEYYFSEFLSVMETREFAGDQIISQKLMDSSIYGETDKRKKLERIYFPENLYIVGTVNMDETTFSFSKKVLDRANTIEFSYVNLVPSDAVMEGETVSENVHNSFLKTKYLQLSQCDDFDYTREISTKLEEINRILKQAEAHIGYRVRDEIVFYMLNNKSDELLEEDSAFDYEIMQKILPRLQGNSNAIKTVLLELFKHCAGDYAASGGLDLHQQMLHYMADHPCRYPKSAHKIAFMIRRYEEDGFTSYWL